MKPERGKGLLDNYDRNARLKPALLTILPASLLAAGLGAGFSAALGILTGSLTTIGFTFVLAQFARDAGGRKEPYLFQLWGGRPTTVKLRHRSKLVNPHTLARYHAVAAGLIGKPIPTPSEEQADPLAADFVYESVVDLLRIKTRDKKKFPLVFTELVNYGFRRNLWGMKPVGLTLASVCIAVQLLVFTRKIVATGSVDPILLVMTVANALAILSWIFLIGPDWVRRVAEEYADRLLEATASLELSKSAKTSAEKKTSTAPRVATRVSKL
jgi:hypothetical protein